MTKRSKEWLEVVKSKSCFFDESHAMRDNMTSNSDGFARHNQLRTVSRTSQGKLSQMFFPPTTNTEATDGKDPMSYRTPHCCSLRSVGGRLSSDIAADHARTMDRVAAALLLVANMINCLLLLYNVSALRSVCTCTMQWRRAPSCSLLVGSLQGERRRNEEGCMMMPAFFLLRCFRLS